MPGTLVERLEKVQQQANISARDVAQLLRLTPETVSRWRTGRAQPHREHLTYFLDLAWLVEQLSRLYKPDEARLWLFSRHRQLGGKTPAELIQQGKIEEVLTVIAQLEDGAYV